MSFAQSSGECTHLFDDCSDAKRYEIRCEAGDCQCLVDGAEVESFQAACDEALIAASKCGFNLAHGPEPDDGAAISGRAAGEEGAAQAPMTGGGSAALPAPDGAPPEPSQPDDAEAFQPAEPAEPAEAIDPTDPNDEQRECDSQEGQAWCDEQCVPVQDNLEHCGQCDNRCGEDAQCQQGQCTCAAYDNLCDGSCVPKRDDDSTSCQFVGDGAAAGPEDYECGCGEQDDTICDGRCVNLLYDPDHCGSCNQPCEGTCSSGTCY